MNQHHQQNKGVNKAWGLAHEPSQAGHKQVHHRVQQQVEHVTELELEEDDRVERGLPSMAVKDPGRVVDKRLIHQLREPAIMIMRRNPLRESKAGHLLVKKQLLALHLPATNRVLQQLRRFH